MKTNKIKTYVLAGLMSGLLYAALASEAASNPAPPDRISLFKVPLQCLAAPQIGCGSRGKPILLELKRNSSVSEAWLNRAGTRIAVVWKTESNVEARANVATKLQEQNATEIRGELRDEDLKDFSSGKGWYRGAEVDRLSEEEAGIIATRLVQRLEAKTTLPKKKAEALEQALDDALKKRLTDDKTKLDENELLKLEDWLQQVAGQYLDKDQAPIFKEAIAGGWGPLPNEK
jgi:hypothetical protein